MEIILNLILVFLFPFAVCELNFQNCGRNSETEIDQPCLGYKTEFGDCRAINKNGRLKFVNCDATTKMAFLCVCFKAILNHDIHYVFPP